MASVRLPALVPLRRPAGVDYLRAAGATPDERVAEAIGIVTDQRDADGRWTLAKVHEGASHIRMDDGAAQPSRWITLRPMRVLDWADRGRR